MQAYDMAALCGETDEEDEELLRLFRRKREKIDDNVIYRDGNGKVWLVPKQELLRVQKQQEDLKKAACMGAGLTVAIAAGGCMVAGIGNPWAMAVFAAVWGGWLLKNVPKEVAG